MLELSSFYTSVPKTTIMWGTVHEIQSETIFLSFWAIFCSLTLLTTQRIKILKKWTKSPRYIIIWYKCTINDNHMIYGSWNINCIKQIFFVILGHFLPFYPPNSSAQKMKISNKWKIWMEMSSFFTRVTKIMIICYVVPEI